MYFEGTIGIDLAGTTLQLRPPSNLFAGVANPDEVVEQVDRATHAAQPAGLGDEPTAPQPRQPGT